MIFLIRGLFDMVSTGLDLIVEEATVMAHPSTTLDEVGNTHEVYQFDPKGFGVVDQNLRLYLDFFTILFKNPTNTHKVEKARYSFEKCVNDGIDIALFGNFGTDLSSTTEGSGIDALEFFSQFYPIHLVGFVPLNEGEDKPYITMETERGSNAKTRIHIDCSEYLPPERLEQIFRCCLNRSAEDPNDPFRELYTSRMAEVMSEYFHAKKANPTYRAITNIYEFDIDPQVYFIDGDLRDKLRKPNVIIPRTVGSGESFLGQIKSLGPTFDEQGKRIGPIYIAITTYGNPLAGWLSVIGNEGHNRLDTPYANPAHAEIVKYMKDKHYDIHLLLLSPDDMTISPGIAAKIKSNFIGDLEVAETGSYGYASILKDHCLTQGEYLKYLGIQDEFPGFIPFNGVVLFHNLKKMGADGMLKESRIVLPHPGSEKYKVYIPFTGCSKMAV